MAQGSNVTAEASAGRQFPGDTTLRQKAGETSMTVPRARTLEELESQFRAISERVQVMLQEAGPELCARPPAEGSWSAIECVQHLNITADAFFPIWQQVISNAGVRKAETNAPYRMDFWGRFVTWILEPPARIRSKTPVPFEPINCGQTAHVLDGFLDRQERMIAALRRCRGRAIDQVKIASPIDQRVRYSIWSSFVINAAHQRRHLWQAERALKQVSQASR